MVLSEFFDGFFMVQCALTVQGFSINRPNMKNFKLSKSLNRKKVVKEWLAIKFQLATTSSSSSSFLTVSPGCLIHNSNHVPIQSLSPGTSNPVVPTPPDGLKNTKVPLGFHSLSQFGLAVLAEQSTVALTLKTDHCGVIDLVQLLLNVSKFPGR